LTYDAQRSQVRTVSVPQAALTNSVRTVSGHTQARSETARRGPRGVPGSGDKYDGSAAGHRTAPVPCAGAFSVRRTDCRESGLTGLMSPAGLAADLLHSDYPARSHPNLPQPSSQPQKHNGPARAMGGCAGRSVQSAADKTGGIPPPSWMICWSLSSLCVYPVCAIWKWKSVQCRGISARHSLGGNPCR